jgi:glucose/arabinose dehydrogenase
MNIRDRVKYSDKQNEEGFLGLAFSPKFKENGEFYVFYTEQKQDLVNVLSRFKVKKDNKNEGDPASEEQLIRFEKPFWNHDGGTIAFGKDGMLYITHGDGGAGGDPQENGQKLSTHARQDFADRCEQEGRRQAVRDSVGQSVREEGRGEARRFTPLASATSGGWPSIRRPANCGPAKSVRTCSKRS